MNRLSGNACMHTRMQHPDAAGKNGDRGPYECNRRAEPSQCTLLKAGGSQSSMPSGWTTASVTTSAMLIVPLIATTTDFRFLQHAYHICSTGQCIYQVCTGSLADRAMTSLQTSHDTGKKQSSKLTHMVIEAFTWKRVRPQGEAINETHLSRAMQYGKWARAWLEGLKYRMSFSSTPATSAMVLQR